MTAFPPPDPATAVAVLTRDRRIVEQLPAALERLRKGSDMRAFASLVDLTFTLIQPPTDDLPKATIVDLEALDGASIDTLLTRRAIVAERTIVVGDLAHIADLTWSRKVAYVLRQGDYVNDLAQRAIAVLDARSGARIAVPQSSDRDCRTILEGMGDGVFVLVDGRFSFVNQPFSALVGHSADSLHGKSINAFVCQGDSSSLAESVRRLTLDGQERDFLHLGLCSAEGDVIDCEIHLTMSQMWGRPGLVGVTRKVRDKRGPQVELEKIRRRATQLERLRNLGELSTGVAHDFNNALGTIMGSIELAREKSTRGEAPDDDLAMALAAGKQASKTIHRVLRFSQPDGANTWEDVDLVALAREATLLVRTQLHDNTAIDTHLTPVPLIRGHAGELLDVLHNLLRNAVDAVQPHDGHIHVTTFTDAGKAVVEVRDNGSGIDDATRSLIFTPFFTTKGTAGTGLGLSVSRWILRCHDATIDMETEVGRGSCFRLTFLPPTPASQMPKDPPRAPTTANMSILIVDDDNAVASMLRDLLHSLGHRAQAAANASQALFALENGQHEVLLIDLDLPDMSGWQLARSARQRAPHLRIGLVTGWPLGASNAELRSRGVDFLLRKPFSLATLRQALDGKTSP